MERRKVGTLLLAVLCVGGLLVLGVSKMIALRQVPVQAARPGLPVETARVVRGPVSSTVRYTASVTSEYETRVAPRVTAPVRSVAVTEGDRVRQGQLLVTLDDSDLQQKVAVLQQKVATAAVNVRYWEKELERYKFLLDEGTIAEQAYDQVKYKYDTAAGALNEAEALLREARGNLSYTRLYAPTDGFVSKIYRFPGDVAVTGQPAVSILATDSLKIRVAVIEGDLARIKPGIKARVSLAALGGKSFISRVSRVDSFVDPQTRTATVDIMVPPGKIDELGIGPGMSAEVAFILAEKEDALLIPHAALIEDDGKWYVYVVEDEQAVRRRVEKGIEGRDMVEIVSGLEVGQQVITSGLQKLYDGRKVYVFTEGSN